MAGPQKIRAAVIRKCCHEARASAFATSLHWEPWFHNSPQRPEHPEHQTQIHYLQCKLILHTTSFLPQVPYLLGIGFCSHKVEYPWRGIGYDPRVHPGPKFHEAPDSPAPPKRSGPGNPQRPGTGAVYSRVRTWVALIGILAEDLYVNWAYQKGSQ